MSGPASGGVAGGRGRALAAHAAAVLAALALAAVPGTAPAHDAGVPLDFSQAPPDTLPWGALAKVAVRQVDGRVVPQFLPPVLALDGRRVTLFGFMAPVGDERLVRQFLLSPQPLLCGSCEPVGPEGIVEVNPVAPVARTDRALAVRGVLHVLHADPKNVLYRLTDARVVTRASAARARSR